MWQSVTAKGVFFLLAVADDEALKTLHHELLDRRLSGVIISNKSGYEPALQLRHRYPQQKIQVASSFRDNCYDESAGAALEERRLQKPHSA